VAGETLQEHFREHGELIDRLLVYRLDEQDKKWDAKLDAKLEAKLEAKLAPVRNDLAAVKHAVEIILTRLT
jgi:hypothetical protein